MSERIAIMSLCCKDVCFYCAGKFAHYESLPDGPTEFGNFVHYQKGKEGTAYCEATPIRRSMHELIIGRKL